MIFNLSVSKWKPWLERVQAEDPSDPFPIDRALRWIELESGGNMCSVGRVGGDHVYEAGLAQTYFETADSVVFGVTSDELRAKCTGTSMPTDLTDDDRMLQARVALLDMKAHRARARSKLKANGASLAESGRDFWCFVKLVHALPGLYSYVGAAKRSLGSFPSWDQFKRYVLSLDAAGLAAIDQGTARYQSAFKRVFDNCEKFAGAGGGWIEIELLLLLAGLALLAHYVI
jgi:hypothetical protein